jgi:hypothetical protein
MGVRRCMSNVDDEAKDRNQERFLMNNHRFLQILDQIDSNVKSVDCGVTPWDTGNGIVNFGGWEFKVSKMIYPSATVRLLEGETKSGYLTTIMADSLT